MWRLMQVLAVVLAGSAMTGGVGALGNDVQSGRQGPWLDAAPFGRVVTWDPARMVGIRAGRVEEIAAEDLALDTEVKPDAHGAYLVKPYENGQACIGLQWLASRKLRRLSISFAEAVDGVELQYWEGASLFQGSWKPATGAVVRDGQRFGWTASGNPLFTSKIRWIFPADGEGVRVEQLVAETTSSMTTSRFRIRLWGFPVTLEAVNGWFVEDGQRTSNLYGDPGEPFDVTVEHADSGAPGWSTSDRPMIRFRSKFEGAGFAVDLDDALHRGPVYVPHARVFVSALPQRVTLEEYQAQVAERKTILQQVRAMPDQTREQAMARTHIDKRLDHGPIMLGLACGNDKFLCHRSGAIDLLRGFVTDSKGRTPVWTLRSVLGEGRIIKQTQGWGMLGLDCAAHAEQGGKPSLQIKDKVYKRGLGHHANGEIVVRLDGDYERFEAEVGHQWSGGGGPGSVVFAVEVDGKERFNSGPMHEADEAKPVSVSVAGAQTLTLKLTDGNDGLMFDGGAWAMARLTDADGHTVHLADLFEAEPAVERHLSGGWLPAPVTTRRLKDVACRQRTYVVPADAERDSSVPAWYHDRAMGVAEYELINEADEPRDARLGLRFDVSGEQSAALEMENDGTRSEVTADGTLIGVIERADLGPLELSGSPDYMVVGGRLAAGATARFTIYLPSWPVTSEQRDALTPDAWRFEALEAYWEGILSEAARITLPDAWLTNVIRANRVHMMLAARNENRGERIVPWIAGDRYYRAIDSEGSSVIRGMYSLGHDDFARRAFAFFFSRYNDQGFMTTGYTLMGNGWHLWALGEFIRLTADTEWFESVSAKPLRLCQWSIEQLAKTRNADPYGNKRPEYGLMPPGVQADWAAYAYYFYMNSYYHAGLKATGEALRAIGHPEAGEIIEEAKTLREEVRRAFKEVQAKTPVVRLRDGTWVPYYPTSVHTPGPIGEFFPGQDANRSWCYDIELGAHHMVPLGTMAPDEPDVDWIMNHMEDVQFLESGWGAYPAERNKADWFNLGGFAKVQPYYARNAEIYAMSDDVKPFLRSYFNTLASLVDGEVLSIYEHFANFVYNKTHETGYFLHQSRIMLALERGDDLWLAPLITDRWLMDGMVIDVADLPTFFGPVSYRITSAIDSGHIDVRIESPQREAPRHLIVRLRHPRGTAIASVTVNGEPWTGFDAAKGLIRLEPSAQPIDVRVDYRAP